jgi:hypothetical protein
MTVTKKDREFAAFGVKRTHGVIYWIESGAVTDDMSLDQKKVLPYQAERVAKYREESAAEALAASNTSEVQEALVRKIKREVAVNFGMETQGLLNDVLEKVRKRVEELA